MTATSARKLLFAIRKPPTVAAVLVVLLCAAGLAAQGPSATASSELTCQEMEAFLREAKIGSLRATSQGVTNPHRATLTDGKITHDAGIQTIHETKASFKANRRVEKNFRDWWEFNVAGYRLAKLLELNMVPPYVERDIDGKPGSVSWWVNGAMMELDRVEKKLNPPDTEAWNRQIYVTRVFNELIYNTDPNLTNFLVTRDWRMWMIDFTRAFRVEKNLLKPKELEQCDRKLLMRMKKLNKPMLEQALQPYLDAPQIEALLARRDKIVSVFDAEIATYDEAQVLFDLPQTNEPCGAGLAR